MVPSTSGANFDDVASYVGTTTARPALELAKVGERKSARGKSGPECERHEHELLVLADGTLGIGLAPEVLRDTEQLGLSVADIEPTEATPPVLLDYRLADQSVFDPAGTRKSADSPTRLWTAPDARHLGQATVPATPALTVASQRDRESRSWRVGPEHNRRCHAQHDLYDQRRFATTGPLRTCRTTYRVDMSS